MAGTSIAEESIRTVSSNSDAAASRASAGSSKSSSGIGAGPVDLSANQQHVDYILVAEFSIDKGSMMEFQYPNPISGDEQ